MFKWTKKLCAVALCGVMAVSLAACGSNEAPVDSAAKEPASVDSATVEQPSDETIRVGVLSIADSLPIFAAEQEGMFEAAGLNVEVYPFKSSADQSKAVEAGELDIVMNDMIVQSLMKKADTDTKVINMAFGADPTEGRFVVVAAPNSGIEKPEDLIGKRVAISTNTMMEYLMAQYEDYFDLDASGIELVNMPDLMLRVETLLQGKDIDAAILPDPLATFAISKGGVAVIDDTTLDENYSQSVYLATNEFMSKNKSELKTFVKVLQDSMTDINEHPDKYRALLMEKARVPEELQETYPIPTFSPGTVPSEQEVTRLEAWMVEKKMLDKVYSYADLVDTSFVKE
jgi:NitT/TauT family transport system substrate-binding protein